MGFFSSKATCGCCGKECGLNRYKIKRSDCWLCPDCLKKAGGSLKIDFNTITIEEINKIVSSREATIKSIKYRDNNDSPPNLSTANEMYLYAKINGFGKGFTDSLALKHFKVIEDCLLSDEYVIMTFIGLHNYISPTKHDNNFAYAITNKRIIMAQKQAVIGEILQTVYLDNINDITYSSKLFGVITIDTIKEVFNVCLDADSAKAVCAKAHEVLNSLRNQSNAQSQTTIVNNSMSDADEILKFKKLLDSGIITQDEFDKKKKQLFGL